MYVMSNFVEDGSLDNAIDFQALLKRRMRELLSFAPTIWSDWKWRQANVGASERGLLHLMTIICLILFVAYPVSYTRFLGQFCPSIIFFSFGLYMHSHKVSLLWKCTIGIVARFTLIDPLST